VFLGGKDWDDRIVEHVANLFKQQYGEDPREHPLSLVALQSAAERAKRNLSKLPQTTITCSHNGKVLSVTLTPRGVREVDQLPAVAYPHDHAGRPDPSRP
jgi:molecular chaperone DnaK